jgi:hypothetical protein
MSFVRPHIEANPRLRPDAHPGGILSGKEDLHVDVAEVEERNRLAARGEHLALLGEPVEDAAADRTLQGRVFDLGLHPPDFGTGHLL